MRQRMKKGFVCKASEKQVTFLEPKPEKSFNFISVTKPLKPEKPKRAYVRIFGIKKYITTFSDFDVYSKHNFTIYYE